MKLGHPGPVMLLVVMAVLVMGCASDQQPDDTLGNKLEQLATGGRPGDVIDLRNVYSGEWTKAAIIPAYTTNEKVKEVLGVEFDAEAAPGMHNDGSYVVVFANDSGVQRWFSVSPQEVGFGAAIRPLVANRDSATAVIGTDSFGDRFLDVSAWSDPT